MSSNLLFDRYIQVSIGQPGQTGKSWDNLRITFKIDKFADSTPNKAEITVTNFSKETQSYIKKGMNLSLTCGYKSDYGQIFTGTIDKIQSVKNGTDWETLLEIKDGGKEFRNTMINKSFSPNSTISTVINDIIKDLGFSKGNLSGIPSGKFSNGTSINLPAKQVLDNYAKSYGFTYTVNDGVIHILSNNSTINSTAILLNPDSGLIGSPETTEKGYKIRSLLRWNIYPVALVSIDSQKLKGNFRIGNINHSGDSRGNDWYSDLEVFPL
jgi:hypothetical protein